MNLEGRQALLRYMSITAEMLVTRFNPFSRKMNDYLREHRHEIVSVSASVLIAQDRRITHKLLCGLSTTTERQVRSDARAMATKQETTSHGGYPYLAVPDILLAIF